MEVTWQEDDEQLEDDREQGFVEVVVIDAAWQEWLDEELVIPFCWQEDDKVDGDAEDDDCGVSDVEWDDVDASSTRHEGVVMLTGVFTNVLGLTSRRTLNNLPFSTNSRMR